MVRGLLIVGWAAVGGVLDNLEVVPAGQGLDAGQVAELADRSRCSPGLGRYAQ